jgi:hypothetical protein
MSKEIYDSPVDMTSVSTASPINVGFIRRNNVGPASGLTSYAELHKVTAGLFHRPNLATIEVLDPSHQSQSRGYKVSQNANKFVGWHKIEPTWAI